LLLGLFLLYIYMYISISVYISVYVYSCYSSERHPIFWLISCPFSHCSQWRCGFQGRCFR
jgi:hypothetical protein